MLLTCVANGWPLAGYAEPDHPLQVAIRAAVEDLAGEPVDRGRRWTAAARRCSGCSLAGLARAFAAAGRPPRRARRSGRSPTRCGRTRTWSAAPAGT